MEHQLVEYYEKLEYATEDHIAMHTLLMSNHLSSCNTHQLHQFKIISNFCFDY